MPNRFVPISSKSSLQKALQQINRNFTSLDAETYTKTISNGANTAMTYGKLPNGRYGLLIYDANGTPRILIGQAPEDSRPGVWISTEGVNVLNAIG